MSNPQEAKAHTPTPWEAEAISVIGVDQEGGWMPIAEVHDYDEGAQAANAAFIVTACNSHEELLEALEALGGAAAEFLLALDEHDFGGEVPATKEAAALDDAIGVAARARAKGERNA